MDDTTRRMTFNEAAAIIRRLTYKAGWAFGLTAHPGNKLSWELRVHFTVPDMITGEPFTFHGRAWPIYPHFTEDEVVGAAFLAVKIAEEHEAMEFFRLDGVSVFNPHISLDARKRAFAETFPDVG